jgi:hypothetical protein
MKSVRPYLIALGALTLTLSCELSPTGVPQAPLPGVPLVDPVAAVVVAPVPCSTLPPTSVTKVIGSAGGSISFGPHKLVVPSGALAKAVSIKAVVPADAPGIEVRLYPDGLTFRKTVYVTISYAHCDLSSIPNAEWLLSNLKIVYVRNGVIVEYIPTVHNATARTLRGGITHFSNYAIAW